MFAALLAGGRDNLSSPHRKELASRLAPGGEEFRQALAAEGAAAQQRHAQREAELEEKLAAGRSQYSALEDEFRMALTIESARFSEVGPTGFGERARDPFTLLSPA